MRGLSAEFGLLEIRKSRLVIVAICRGHFESTHNRLILYFVPAVILPFYLKCTQLLRLKVSFQNVARED